MKRLDELDSPLNTSTELHDYVKKVRDLCRDFYMELEFAATELQQNLATLPVAESSGGAIFGGITSRIRARQVAACLRRAGEAQKYSGGQAVKAWAMFKRVFAPEIDAANGKNGKKPAFNVGE
jgi:hypothetical protein